MNEAFVKRFFKNGENPMDQHFGLDLPENVGTYRIIGIVRDAKFAGFALSKPARPMFYVPLAQSVDYKNELMGRLELSTHYIRGIMLVTNTPTGTLEPLLTRARGGSGSQPDHYQHQNHATTSRTLLRPGACRRQPRRPVRNCGAATWLPWDCTA